MMTHKHVPPPHSRRERPAKPALTRQGIIEIALSILHEEGLNKVTMRRIAEALDTGPASLYVYVRNTTDLHIQLLDALLAPILEELPGEGAWRERLKGLLAGYTFVLRSYPEIARMALRMHPSGPNYLALLEHVLALLQEGGMSDREAAWEVDLLFLYATATAAEHSTREGTLAAEEEDSALVAAIREIDAEKHPHLARIGNDIFSGGGHSRFHWGIEVLLSGALATPRTGVDDLKEWTYEKGRDF